MEARVLEELSKNDPQRTGRVRADIFQLILNTYNVPIGSTLGDRIVLKCRVVANGDIDYSAMLQNEQTPSPQKLAVDTSVHSINMDIDTPTARQRVFEAAEILKEAYMNFDMRYITMAQLHQTVVSLGLYQTAEYKAIVAQVPVDLTYTKFCKALLQIPLDIQEKPRKPDGTSSNTPLHAAGCNPKTPTGIGRYPCVRSQESVESPFTKQSQEYEDTPPIAKATPPRIKYQVNLNILKEQVFCLIRLLSKHEIETEAFIRKIKALGLEVPPAVMRLLSKVESDGMPNFSEFVRAFDSVFSTLPAPVNFAASASPPVPPAKIMHPAVRTNGDFLSWDSTRHEEHVRKVRNENSSSKHLLEWNISSPTNTSETEYHGIRRSPLRSSGDIIRWTTQSVDGLEEPMLAPKETGTTYKLTTPYGIDQ